MEADVAIYVFWAWLAVSAVLVVIQLIRRARFRRTMRRREESLGAERAAGLTPPQRPTVTAPASAVDAPEQPMAAPDDAATSGPAASDAAAEDAGTAAQDTGAASSPNDDVIDLERDSVIETEPAIDVDVDAARLGALLSGVSLPHGLLPGGPMAEDALRLRTDDADAAEVGTALADELERRGFEISPIGDDRAEARRDDEVLSMQIRPLDAATEVDLWAGSRANPLLDQQHC